MLKNNSPFDTFASVALAPGDPILGLTEAFSKDERIQKANLTIGVYQNEHGQIPILECVKQASKLHVNQESSKSYLPIDGLKSFHQSIARLVLGEHCAALDENCVASMQTVAGSGALKVAGELIAKVLGRKQIALSNPSWENHRAIFEGCGLGVRNYAYYNATTSGIDLEQMCADLEALPAATPVLFHACCHNPTGVDVPRQAWERILEIVSAKSLLPFFDLAYLGFADGIEEDAYPLRLFARERIPMLIAVSCSKNFGLYRERVGALIAVTSSSEQATNLLSQAKRIVRTIYSSPPSFGAQVASEILNSKELKQLWENEVAQMRNRIQGMRREFVDKLAACGAKRDFGFIMKQRGMFSYSGISEDAVEKLRVDSGVYALKSGRICVAALNPKNLSFVCESIAKAI